MHPRLLKVKARMCRDYWKPYVHCYVCLTGVGPPFRGTAISSSDNLRLGIRLGLGLGSVVWLWQYQELFPATTMNDGFQHGGPFGMADPNCLIGPARACPLRRLAKWQFSQFPVHTAERTRLFRTIGLMLFDRRHAKGRLCVCLVSVFRRRTVFTLLTPKFHQIYTEKSDFGEKPPDNGNSSKFRYERIHRHMHSCIPAKFCGNRQSGSEETGARYSSRKKGWCFAPCSWGNLAENFIGPLIPHST